MAKLPSAGSAANAGGNAPAGTHGPFASGAASQPPLRSRNQVLLRLSWNTSQFVLTTDDSVVFAIGASTGAPSNTTRLAGRALVKIAGGLFSIATSGGFCADCARLAVTIATGTRLTPRPDSTSRMRSCSCALRASSSVGNFADTRRGSVRITVRSGRSTAVVNEISTVPSVACFAPAGVTPTTPRVLSVRWSGHEMTCGW